VTQGEDLQLEGGSGSERHRGGTAQHMKRAKCPVEDLVKEAQTLNPFSSRCDMHRR
jgi:hypothetical protein